MKTVTITIDLYNFDELTAHAKNVAIRAHWDFLNQVVDSRDEHVTRDYVIDSIRMNEYRFYLDGEMAHTQYNFTKKGKKRHEVYIHQTKHYVIS